MARDKLYIASSRRDRGWEGTRAYIFHLIIIRRRWFYIHTYNMYIRFVNLLSSARRAPTYTHTTKRYYILFHIHIVHVIFVHVYNTHHINLEISSRKDVILFTAPRTTASCSSTPNNMMYGRMLKECNVVSLRLSVYYDVS